MELILYYYIHEGYNFYSVFVKSVCKLFKVPLSLVPSDYSWSTVGDLPVLQIDSFLFREQSIPKILKQIFDLDSKLNPDCQAILKEIEDLCYSTIHKSLKLAQSKRSSAVDSYEYHLNQYKELFQGTLKLVNPEASSSINSDVEYSLRSIQKTNEILSDFLSENDFFSQKFDFYNLYLEDLTIFAYLKEELFYLGHLEEVQNFKKHENLKKFLKFVEERLEIGQNPLKLKKDPKVLLELCEKRGHSKEIKVKDPYVPFRREFVSLTLLTFLGFLLINSR